MLENIYERYLSHFGYQDIDDPSEAYKAHVYLFGVDWKLWWSVSPYPVLDNFRP